MNEPTKLVLVVVASLVFGIGGVAIGRHSPVPDAEKSADATPQQVIEAHKAAAESARQSAVAAMECLRVSEAIRVNNNELRKAFEVINGRLTALEVRARTSQKQAQKADQDEPN